jgi:hypothetical protein
MQYESLITIEFTQGVYDESGGFECAQRLARTS